MLRSMTGYGRFTSVYEKLAYTWEVRSVNGKSLDIKIKLPQAMRSEEARFDKMIRITALRGRIEASLEIKASDVSCERIFDFDTALSFCEQLKTAAANRGITAEIDFASLVQIPYFWKDPNQQESTNAFSEALETGLNQALADWNYSREREAETLAADLKNRFRLMRCWLAQIEECAPKIKQKRLEGVHARLCDTLASLDSGLDEGRFLQEIVILSDKLDVTEELTRLKAHLGRMEELTADGSDCGRKLDFTLQEAFREINTCGNKVQDSAVSQIVVDFKTELEKCREQAQNLE